MLFVCSQPVIAYRYTFKNEKNINKNLQLENLSKNMEKNVVEFLYFKWFLETFCEYDSIFEKN